MPDHNFLGPELFAAFCGAVIGAGATLIAQERSFANERKARISERTFAENLKKIDKSERESILALSILTKLNKSLSTIADMHNHLHDGFLESIRRGMTFPAAMKAFSTDPEKIEFTLEEFVLVRDLRKANLLMLLMDTPSTQALYIDNMAVFRRMRIELDSMAEVESVGSAGTATLTFTGVKALRAQMKITELTNLQLALWSRSWDDVRRTNNLMFDLQSAFGSRLGKEAMKIEFVMTRLLEPPPLERSRRGLGTAKKGL